jgi:hypothetical protein
MTFQTEFEFSLPRGYVDANGLVHRNGKMRLSTALDEIESINDPRVQANDAYLPIVLLSRVVTQLGGLTPVSAHVIESLYVSDFALLEDIYLRINSQEPVMLGATCPHCSQAFQLQVAPLGTE